MSAFQIRPFYEKTRIRNGLVFGGQVKDLDAIWNTLVSQDDQFQTYITKKDHLRSVLDGFGDEVEGVFHQEIHDARADLDSHIDGWRISISQSLSALFRDRADQIAANKDLAVPVYLKVIAWDESEQGMLEKGHEQFKRNEQLGRTESSETIEFYEAALARSEVVQAKINFDVRATLYNQRFAAFLVSLD